MGKTPTGEAKRHQNSTSPIRRALRLLNAFGPSQPELGVSELSRIVGLHKTTVYRILVTLEEEGFVKRNPANDKCSLGPSIIRLGYTAMGNADLGKIAPRHMRSLAEETGETAMIEIWHSGRTLVIGQVEGHHFSHVLVRAGHHLPAHCSSGGKAILAFLPSDEINKVISSGLRKYTEHTITDPQRLLEELASIRAKRVSYDRQETDVGVCAVSAPIFDHLGAVAGALTVGGPTQRIHLGEDSALVQLTKRTAEAISAELGYRRENQASNGINTTTSVLPSETEEITVEGLSM